MLENIMEIMYFASGFMSALVLIVCIVLFYGYIETRKEKKCRNKKQT
jgi:hypothetical protein